MPYDLQDMLAAIPMAMAVPVAVAPVPAMGMVIKKQKASFSSSRRLSPVVLSFTRRCRAHFIWRSLCLVTSAENQRVLQCPACATYSFKCFMILAMMFCFSCGALDDRVFAAIMSEHPKALYDCGNASQYYKQLDGLKGDSLKQKLFTIINGHHSITYAEVWNALKILDAADPNNPEASPDVIEIYSQRAVPKKEAGKHGGWNREHLWPRSYGIKKGRPEYTDLHNLRPSYSNVNSARGNKYYGECSKIKSKLCSEPANVEAAADTATNKDIWMPPSKVRGDIARALMYMAVRYGTKGEGALQLCETPSAGNACMGRVSVLLHWNTTDPPSLEEKMRNLHVCSLYQNNRNPFVDHPEFANMIWGDQDRNQWGFKAFFKGLTKAIQDGLLKNFQPHI